MIQKFFCWVRFYFLTCIWRICLLSFVVEGGNVLNQCSHLLVHESQENYFQTEFGQNCCLCPAGTFLSEYCNDIDPNSTICHPCERTSEKKTYVHYGPHRLTECFPDIKSCPDGMVLFEGSVTKKSRCDCPSGQVAIRGLKCVDEKTSVHSTTATTSTATVTSTLTSSLTTITENTSNAPLETKLIPTVSAALTSSKDPSDGYKDFPTKATIDPESPTTKMLPPNLTILAEDVEIESYNYVPIVAGVLVGLAVIIIILVLVIRLKTNRSSPDYGKGISVEFESGTTLNTLNGSRSSSSAQPMPGGNAATPLMGGALPNTEDSVSEESETANAATPLIKEIQSTSADPGSEKSELIVVNEAGSPKKNTASPILETPDAPREVIPEHVVCTRSPEAIPDQIPQQPCTCPKPTTHRIPGAQPRPKISPLHAEKRKETYGEIAKIIQNRDLNGVASKILSQGTEYWDIQSTTNGDTPERARRTFRRAIELNPDITLWDLHELVVFNGDLHNIVSRKIRELSQNEPEAWS